ncbi:MAG: TM2 domain-containing protein, partial [Eubacteriales bacterium]|nr:TM2 domain-containing protein [Eubacteriales bacterium]
GYPNGGYPNGGGYYGSGMYPGGMMPVSDKSKLTAALLCLFFGGFGVHRFYLGHSALGGVMVGLTVFGILTSILIFGIFIVIGVGVWAFVDFIMILTGSIKDANGLPLR